MTVSIVIGTIICSIAIIIIGKIGYKLKRTVRYSSTTIITIGEYDRNEIHNLPMDKDSENLTNLFQFMIYKMLEANIENNKHWSDKELIDFLKNEIPISMDNHSILAFSSVKHTSQSKLESSNKPSFTPFRTQDI